MASFSKLQRTFDLDADGGQRFPRSLNYDSCLTVEGKAFRI